MKEMKKLADSITLEKAINTPIAMSDLTKGLTSTESQQIVNTFIGWARDDRERAIADCSRDIALFREAQVARPTYTREETVAMLDSIAATVRATVTTSHEKFTESCALLCRAVLAEADMQRVLLTGVKTVEALNSRRNLSAAELATQRTLMSAPGGPRPGALAPIGGDGGGGGDLKLQLQQANDMIRNLREKLHLVEDQYRKVMDEKSRLQGANFYLGDQLLTEEQRVTKERQQASANSSAVTAAGQKTAAALQQELDAVKAQHTKDIDAHRKELMALNKKVNDLVKEQQGKLGESGQFQSMKKMLREKTDQVKKLRDLLRPHNPAAAGADDDIEAAEDDD